MFLILDRSEAEGEPRSDSGAGKDQKKGVLEVKPTGYNVKVIVSGHVIEVYEYTDTIWRNLKSKTSKSNVVKVPSTEELDELILDKKLNSRAKSNIRARNNIRRLILANFNNRSKFLTLTFKENVTSLEEANKEFKKFIRKLRSNLGNFKYVAVIEFQKRGAVHYHGLLDIKYVRVSKLAEWWGNGFIKINDIRHVDNVGAYVVKYMTKADADERLIGKKMYQCSKNLERPREFVGKEAEYILERLKAEKRKVAYSNVYQSKLTGNEIRYSEYNLYRS